MINFFLERICICIFYMRRVEFRERSSEKKKNLRVFSAASLVGLSLPPCAALPGRRLCLSFSLSPPCLCVLLASLLFLFVFSLFFCRLSCPFAALQHRRPPRCPSCHLVFQCYRPVQIFFGSQMGFFKNSIYVTQEDPSLHAPSHRHHRPLSSQHHRPIIHQHCTCRSVFTTSHAFDHSTVTTGLQASLQLHAIHLLLCRSVLSFAVFLGRRVP